MNINNYKKKKYIDYEQSSTYPFEKTSKIKIFK